MSTFAYTVPVVPTVSSVERLSGPSARVNWIPLTPDEAKGILTLLEIAYEPVRGKDCADFYPMDSGVVYVRENLLEQNTACLLYTSPSPRDATLSRMPSSA